MDIKSWLQRLPKSEYHLHLEGTIPWEMAYNAPGESLPKQPQWSTPGFRFDDFRDFSEAMSVGISRVIRSPADYGRIARYHFQILAEQNAVYVETSIGVDISISRDFDLKEVIQAIHQAAPDDMTVRVVGAFHREIVRSDEAVQDILQTPGLIGIDLHGDERLGSIEPFVEIYAEARRLGLRTKSHAGELRDAAYVAEVIEMLQPQRIQHGITAADDDRVCRMLAERNIILDLCPTSNVMLRVVPDIGTYPLRKFLEYGVAFTVNTDDPGIFGCTLTSELLSLIEHDILTAHEVAAMQRTALKSVNLSDDKRRAINQEFDTLMQELE